jgi:hypothetical protein
LSATAARYRRTMNAADYRAGEAIKIVAASC